MAVTTKTPLDSIVEWVPEMRPANTPLTGVMRLFVVRGPQAWVITTRADSPNVERAYAVARKALRVKA